MHTLMARTLRTYTGDIQGADGIFHQPEEAQVDIMHHNTPEEGATEANETYVGKKGAEQTEEEQQTEKEEREKAQEKEWEEEEADVMEDEDEEAHTVLPVDSDGEDDNDTDGGSFEGFLKTLGENERTYITNIVDGTCSCPDRVMVGFICKHLFRAVHEAGKEISCLPKTILEAPHLCIDYEALRMDTDVMPDLILPNSDDEFEDDVEEIPSTGRQEGSQEEEERSARSKRPSPCSTSAPTRHANDPGVSTRDKERTFNNLCGSLKSLNSFAHNGTLTDEQLFKFEEGARVLFEELANMEKSDNETQGDFAQVGKVRKRKVDTQSSGKLFKKTKPSEPEIEEEDFDLKRSRGRPPTARKKLPGRGEAVNWKDIDEMSTL